MKERNLIISWGAYDWIKGCIIPVLREPKKFEVIVVCKDNVKPISACSIELCREALYSQRAHDLLQVGTKLRLPKLTNLMFDEEDLDIDKLTAKLQLSIVLGGINKIYFSYNELLLTIMSVINKKLDIDIYSFNDGSWESEYHRVLDMTEQESKEKQDLVKLCIGDYGTTKHIEAYEIFHKI